MLWSGNSRAHGVGMCGRVDVTSLLCVCVCVLGDSVVMLCIVCLLREGGREEDERKEIVREWEGREGGGREGGREGGRGEGVWKEGRERERKK